jgi:hypothetical protein
MRTKSDREKISIKKMIREKQITIIKIRTKVDIKIKLNQILRDEIEKKKIQNKIYSNQKFEDQI